MRKWRGNQQISNIPRKIYLPKRPLETSTKEKDDFTIKHPKNGANNTEPQNMTNMTNLDYDKHPCTRKNYETKKTDGDSK